MYKNHLQKSCFITITMHYHANMTHNNFLYDLKYLSSGWLQGWIIPFISRYRLSNSISFGFGWDVSTGILTPSISFGYTWTICKLSYTKPFSQLEIRLHRSFPVFFSFYHMNTKHFHCKWWIIALYSISTIFLHWDIFVICPIIILKPTITVFSNLHFWTSWLNWIDRFGHFKKFQSITKKSA